MKYNEDHRQFLFLFSIEAWLKQVVWVTGCVRTRYHQNARGTSPDAGLANSSNDISPASSALKWLVADFLTFCIGRTWRLSCCDVNTKGLYMYTILYRSY